MQAGVALGGITAGNRIKKTDAKGATIYQFNRKNQLITEEGSNGKTSLHMTGRAV